MSITDELREWLEGAYNYGTGEHLLDRVYRPWFGWKATLEPMLDRIDAEHESMVGCTADEWDYWESTHIELPKDADGEYIHIGDVVEEFDTRTVGRACGEVIRIVFNKHLTNVRIDTGRSYADRNPANVRHVSKQPTVEDVLREFYVYAVRGKQAYAEDVDVTVLADYAKRLRLAGEDE